MSLKTNVIESLNRLADKQDATYKAGMKNARTKPLPPAGQYPCAITDVDANEYTDKETGEEHLNIEVSFRVMDDSPDQAGFAFSKTYWGNSEFDMGALVDLAKVATGATPGSYRGAIEALGNAEGAVVQIRIVEKASTKKQGVINRYVNVIG